MRTQNLSVTALEAGKVKIVSQLQHGKRVVVWIIDVCTVCTITPNNLFGVHAAALKGI